MMKAYILDRYRQESLRLGEIPVPEINDDDVLMKADGPQLRKLTRLLEAGTIMPVIDRVFSFEAVNEALAYSETGRAKGKVVIQMKQAGP